jgi:hypothetical protein
MESRQRRVWNQAAGERALIRASRDAMRDFVAIEYWLWFCMKQKNAIKSVGANCVRPPQRLAPHRRPLTKQKIHIKLVGEGLAPPEMSIIRLVT